MNGLSRTLILFGAFALGAIFPQMAQLAFLIQYMVVYMLFLSYLSMPLKGNPVKKMHLWILLANIALGLIPYFILKPFSQEYALVAYMSGIIPSAIAVPVIMAMIHRDVAFAATSVLVTNLSMAIIIPVTLPWLVGQDIHIDVTYFVIKVMLVLIGPFVLAMVLRKFVPKVTTHLKKLNRITFFIWVTAIWIAVAKSVVYLKTQNDVSLQKMLITASIVFCICFLSFAIGHLIGGKTLNKEASQSLGQKNVMFSIWISLTYLNPFIAMGPTFYILFHHLYNGWLLFRYSNKKP
jgi:bile acid:Na+ symporter, BASS family